MKKTYDKKAAIKLINNYAEQYYRIADECKKLSQEVTDLRLNIKISKEIIESFYKTIPMKDKQDTYLVKTREEMVLLTKMNNKMTKEIQSLRNKTNYYEQIINKSISDYRESTESLQDRIFILENALIKKDNMISIFNSKLSKLQEEEDYSNEEDGNNNNHHHKNEVYIIDPSMSVNLIQDDLMLYKQAYENALHKLKENNNLAERYENRIDQLRNEIVKWQSKCSDREWENGIIDLSDKIKFSKNNKKPNKNLGNISTIHTINKEDIELLMQSETGMNVMTIVNKCIEDKNNEIERLRSELKEQSVKYKKLNEDNMSLLKTIMDYKSNSQMPKCYSNNNGNNSTKSNNKDSYADSYLNTNISMIGNTSGEVKKRNRNYNDITDKLNKIHHKRSSFCQSMDDPQISFDYI